MNFSQMQSAERGRSLFFQTVAHALSLPSDVVECLINGFPSHDDNFSLPEKTVILRAFSTGLKTRIGHLL